MGAPSFFFANHADIESYSMIILLFVANSKKKRKQVLAKADEDDV